MKVVFAAAAIAMIASQGCSQRGASCKAVNGVDLWVDCDGTSKLKFKVTNKAGKTIEGEIPVNKGSECNNQALTKVGDSSEEECTEGAQSIILLYCLSHLGDSQCSSKDLSLYRDLFRETQVPAPDTETSEWASEKEQAGAVLNSLFNAHDAASAGLSSTESPRLRPGIFLAGALGGLVGSVSVSVAFKYFRQPPAVMTSTLLG